MRIVLATGIYPPDIGGPATYVQHLRDELQLLGHDITVVTYGAKRSEEGIIAVSRSGGPLLRYWRYARALRQCAADADIIYSFSSVSCSLPIWLAGLKKPLKILRLGGDFFWERYTALGGRLPLADWYKQPATKRFWQPLMQFILRRSNQLVYSTDFQHQLYSSVYSGLPAGTVIQNALPHHDPVQHQAHRPFRLLAMARLVRFKNLNTLIEAVADMDNVALTIVGDGPCKIELQAVVERLNAHQAVTFIDAVAGNAKQTLFAAHDVFIVPSLTDISPNAALEAASFGLPVLLTDQHGLSAELAAGMQVYPMLTKDAIIAAVEDVRQNYDNIAKAAVDTLPQRNWSAVASDHEAFFSQLLTTEIRR